jgi:uncharacterized membrane protein YdjX (TVP38/TMEM64 family)
VLESRLSHPIFANFRKQITHNRPKLIALLFWAMVAGGYWWYTNQHNLSPADVLTSLVFLFTETLYRPVLFVLFFTVQPLVFFPSTLMGILAGCFYGPVGGMIATILGGNGAGILTFAVGRFFGQGVLPGGQEASFVQRHATRLRENAFETILIMHLIFLPFDLVNYAAGFLRVSWRAFILATVLGSIPGMFTFVLFGASLEMGEHFLDRMPTLNPTLLFFSVMMLVVSVSLSQYLKRRQPLSSR